MYVYAYIHISISKSIYTYQQVSLPGVPSRAARHVDRLFYLAPLNVLLICDDKQPGATLYYPGQAATHGSGTLGGHTAPVVRLINN